MKTTVLSLAFLLIFSTFTAQNKDVKETTTTTTTTVTTPTGEKKFVKEENVKEEQKIELNEAQPNTLNIERKDSPVLVTTTTKITNPDGSTRTVDIDRSAMYQYNGNQYKVNLDASGYTMTLGNSKPALLRKTSTNSYIYRLKNKVSVGYFDTDGNLILESYDEKSDAVNIEKYSVVKK